MAHRQHDNKRGQSAIQNLLNMFHLTNTPTIPIGDDDLNGEADEPPDDEVSSLQAAFRQKDNPYMKTTSLPKDRRESLLTRALMGCSPGEEQSSATIPSPSSRGMSTTSSHSVASLASTAELTSDDEINSPARTETPSPPLPKTRYGRSPLPKVDTLAPPNAVLTSASKSGKTVVTDVSEANVEATLGRKRCIMFACGGKGQGKPEAAATAQKQEAVSAEPLKRRCMLTFACPTRNNKMEDPIDSVSKRQAASTAPSRSPTTPSASKPSSGDLTSMSQGKQPISLDTSATPIPKTAMSNQELSQSGRFCEFGTSHDETDAWVNEKNERKGKLTLIDCMKKENAIRQIGEEAEEEAEQEEQEAEDLDAEIEDGDNEDDFAPSDEAFSDPGNESDNEEGFAASDDENNAGSDDLFWAPLPGTIALTSPNQLKRIRPFSSRRGSVDSCGSSLEGTWSRRRSAEAPKYNSRRRPPKAIQMRPRTPELPDSTDFVCGTLDEDRPLEAAYISCREQKMREKHIPIPQDIDPSFPTSDPEDNDDNDEEQEDNELWLKDQLDGFDDDTHRGRVGALTKKKSPLHSPKRLRSPPTKGITQRPGPSKYPSHRSPPPTKHYLQRSPPTRRLFGHSPTRAQSPPSTMKLKSPPGTRRPSCASSPTNQQILALDMNISRLGHRPHMTRTASLPHTPNPFFRDYKAKTSQAAAFNLTSGAADQDNCSKVPARDMHVRGPVDIVIGLEKKRQKRKEKFWRQHCRKHAKEQAERKPVPGRGAERMKELGLECAERTRGYGLGQPAQLVISL